MLDTKGPEIRTGKVKGGGIELRAGAPIIVSTNTGELGDQHQISIDYQDLTNSVQPGGLILIADGNISLTIDRINHEKRWCECTINNTAILGDTKNVHLPGGKVTLPAVSPKDVKDLLFGVEKGVDVVAASFIRSPNDVKEIRKILGERGRDIKIISKIESTEGLENFDAILHESDGIMVARGDLGVELPMEQIFIAQKMMVSKCNALGKPVITATQMLDSMITNPRPTRAEATDVANAVLDGSDCVMLSGETASGNYPVPSVEYMRKIALEAEHVETASDHTGIFEALRTYSKKSVPEVVASYSVRTARDVNASLIFTITETGNTSRLVSKYRPSIPVICLTSSTATANFLLLSRTCLPMVVPSLKGTSKIVDDAIQRAKQMGLCRPGDKVVLVSGVVEGVPGNSNALKVLDVPE